MIKTEEELFEKIGELENKYYIITDTEMIIENWNMLNKAYPNRIILALVYNKADIRWKSSYELKIKIGEA